VVTGSVDQLAGKHLSSIIRRLKN